MMVVMQSMIMLMRSGDGAAVKAVVTRLGRAYSMRCDGVLGVGGDSFCNCCGDAVCDVSCSWSSESACVWDVSCGVGVYPVSAGRLRSMCVVSWMRVAIVDGGVVSSGDWVMNSVVSAVLRGKSAGMCKV